MAYNAILSTHSTGYLFIQTLCHYHLRWNRTFHSTGVIVAFCWAPFARSNSEEMESRNDRKLRIGGSEDLGRVTKIVVLKPRPSIGQ